MGLSPRIEGEQMDIELDGFNHGDRTKLALPAVQQQLIKKIVALGKPVVLVLLNGSAVAINWEKGNVPAIIETWYGRQQGGTAIADVLTGKYNPSGRLPVTFYTSEKDLPAFTDYNMVGRTYRYYKEEPLYEFGYGLSYTQFTYTQLKMIPVTKIGNSVEVRVDVQNTGDRDGEEVVQLYLGRNNATAHSTVRSLIGFSKITLKKGEKKSVSFTVPATAFSYIDAANKRVITAAGFQVAVGGKQPTTYDPGNVLTQQIQLTGKQQILEL